MDNDDRWVAYCNKHNLRLSEEACWVCEEERNSIFEEVARICEDKRKFVIFHPEWKVNLDRDKGGIR